MKFVLQAIFSRRIFACSVLTLLFCTSLAGQSTYTGGLSGEVTDTSGAIIAGAKITLTDQSANVQATTTSDTKGMYVEDGKSLICGISRTHSFVM
jgi:hypothetical protein